ncbi:hypothetical protein [Streptomyces griseosporeus]|uniref:hypothetical protein n=1 Tax=Streptomyces griseosporeus TaxID=1910 RepID=UPI0036FC05A8
MRDEEQYDRYRADARALTAIGACLAPQLDRVTVRLPRELAEAAVAAWQRDEPAGPGSGGPESAGRHALRDQAAELALIGLGGVSSIRPGSRRLAPRLAALSSVPDSPTLDFARAGAPPSRRLPPPPCDARHQTPLADPA